MENQERIVFLPRGKRKKIAKCRRLYWLLGKCLIIDWSHFPPASDFSIVVTDLKVSTDSMSSSTVGFLIRWWILFERRSMFEILTELRYNKFIRNNKIIKLFEITMVPWAEDDATRCRCQTQESPAPACPAVCCLGSSWGPWGPWGPPWPWAWLQWRACSL